MPLFHEPEDAPDKLTKLMLTAVPENERGYKTLTHLADLIGVSKWGLRKWINAQKIPPDRVVAIVRISEGRVAAEDFNEFVYKD
jgi:hypothetical protein